ncbi:MAG TPA: 30S ribosomal protein S20 [Candidatus Paceibacterota bacterium]
MITKSAQKAYRQNITRRARNDKRKQNLKKVLKTYKKLVIAKKLDEAKTELVKVYQSLDKNAKVGIIKPNKAARLKSRLTILLSKASAK